MSQSEKQFSQHQKRVIIIEILYQYFLDQENQANLNTNLELEKENHTLPEHLINQVQDIVWYQSQLVSEIQKNLKESWHFKSLKPIEKSILLLASYEILHTDTQKAIIINEAVILAKQYCDNNAYKYINGVLDKITK